MSEDRAGRRAAQTEFDLPLVLEAGAGTGKTTTLVARILAWCLGRGWAEAAGRLAGEAEGRPAAEPDRVAAAVLDGVVAITFTEAAAAEMATRVAAGLAELAATEGAGLVGFDPGLLAGEVSAAERRRRARHLLGALDHLSVRTIHAWCRHLLASHPLEAGLHPDLTVDADGRLVEEVVRAVVERETRRAYADASAPPLLRLAGRGSGPRAVAEALVELVTRGFPAAALAEDPFAPAAVEAMAARLVERLEGFRRADGGRLARVTRGDKAPRLARAVAATLEALGALPGAAGLEAATALCAIVAERWDPKDLRALRAWERGDFTRSEAAALGADAARLGAEAGRLAAVVGLYLRMDPALLDLARRALAPLLAAIETELRSRGVATFADLLREARDLLARDPRVRSREQARIGQLLVDEFQDTDRLQCDLVRLLALEGAPAGRPGLFVVGDPKQSIYGWRNADLAAYGEFVERALAAGGRVYPLVENFRSAPPILDEVTRVVEPVMVERAGLQPAFEPLVPCAALAADAGFTAAGRAPIEYWVSWPPDPARPGALDPRANVDEAARLEARAVARDVAALHAAGESSWKDFGVLFRSTGNLEVFLEAFREAGVPFAVTRDKQYYRRREIIEAAALVRAVVNPVDQVALVAFLRSAAVGVPDAAWIPLWRRGFPGLATELGGGDGERLDELRTLVAEAAGELPAGVPGLERIAGWERSLGAALEDLAELRRSFLEEPPDRFIERLRRRLLVEAGEGARHLGAYRVANLDRFFRQLEVALERPESDVQALLRSLRRSVSEALEAEEALPRESAEDAVQVMTIHKAKGLEFEHVYFVQLHARAGRGEPPPVDCDEAAGDGPAEYALFGAPTPGFDRVEARRRRVAAAELVRTLYVALTRARRRLVVVGRWPERVEPKDPGRSESHLDLALHRPGLPGSLAELLDLAAGAAGAAAGEGIDRDGIRWRFVGRDPEARAPAAGGARRRLPSPREVKAASDRLRTLAAAADDRMERPLVAAASAEAAERLGELADGAAGGAPREAALAVGVAVHRMFEEWDLEAEPAAELERGAAALLARLRASLPADLAASAVERAEALLERIRGGALLGRFAARAPHVLARELPVLLPPEPVGGGDLGAVDAVGAVAGVVDLVCRDPETGETVVVDFKTDAVESEDELRERARAYASQEAVYRRAVQEALALPAPPAGELWFLWPDRMWRTS